jgi:hypothetical protein
VPGGTDPYGPPPSHVDGSIHWWRSEVLARLAMALLAVVAAGYLVRLLTSFVMAGAH